jgi:hypothetical protein
MKTLFTILAFAFLNLTAYAGQELDKFKQDVDTYMLAQAVNPTKLIKYSDANGDLARTVLDPNRLQKIISLIYKDQINNNRLEFFFDIYMPVVFDYLKVFKTSRESYDEEYIDAFESLYHMMVTMPEQERKHNSTAAQITQLHKSSGMSPSMSDGLLSNFEKDITDGKFSKFYNPIAKLRLLKLQSVASKP